MLDTTINQAPNLIMLTKTLTIEYLTYLKASGQADKTVQLRAHQFRRITHALPTTDHITPAKIADWLSLQQWSPNTRRSHCVALKSFIRWCVEREYLPATLLSAVPRVKSPHHLPRPCSHDALNEALANAETRVLTMLMLGAMLGLRREEISRVHTDNYLYSSNGLSLWVRGKGDRDRLLAVPDNLSALLLCHTQGFIFPGQIDGHLSPEYVGKLMSQAIPGRFSAHSLRHFFGTTAYGFTHDILLVQTMLGHSSPATTQIYVQLDTRGQRDTINQISDMLAA